MSPAINALSLVSVHATCWARNVILSYASDCSVLVFTVSLWAWPSRQTGADMIRCACSCWVRTATHAPSRQSLRQPECGSDKTILRQVRVMGQGSSPVECVSFITAYTVHSLCAGRTDRQQPPRALASKEIFFFFDCPMNAHNFAPVGVRDANIRLSSTSLRFPKPWLRQ